MRPNIYSRINRLSRFHIVLVLAMLGFLAYANAIRHPFVHDDIVFIEQNPRLADLNLKNIFFREAGSVSNFQVINKYYRPLLELVNRLLYRVIGLNPHGFHFFNILLHIVNSFLIYVMVRFVIGNEGIPLAAAVLFLLHPVQNEAVACISGISNLIFTFLCLMSFYAYLASAHSAEGKKELFLYGASLMFFLLALFAKEQAVVLPVLIIAYEFCFMKRPFKEALKKYGPPIGGFFIVLAGYFVMRKMLFGFALLRPMDNQGELWIRLLAIPRSLLVYLGLIFFPHDLHYYRSQDILLPFLGPLLWNVVIVFIVIALVYRTPKPQKTWMIFGLAWFMISLGPTLNIVPLINEYSNVLTAEHFLYFPLIGMLLFVIGAVHYWVGRNVRDPGLIGLTAVGILSAVFIGYNIKLNTYWRGEIPLFERTLRFEKDFGRVRFLLAKAYALAGEYEKAVGEDRKALAIMQGYERKVQKEEVKKFYTQFIKEIHYHLGYCLDILGDPQAALTEFKNSLNLDPENGTVHYSVGLSYLKLGDVENAIAHFEESLGLHENDLMTMNSLAICYQEVGRYDEAERLLRTIADKDGRSVSAKKNLENFLKKKQAGGFQSSPPLNGF